MNMFIWPSLLAFWRKHCPANGFDETPELIAELRLSVRAKVGAFCMPDLIVITPSLPMTRSGKIMRRILRKIVCGETDTLGDTSTLADPSIVDTLINKVESLKEAALV
jgi:acetyl-CoA synthetase